MTRMSVRPAKLADAVAQYIEELILEGTLPPGERLLSERDLSAKLDVSRPSLRDALDILIERGLVTTDTNGACYISEKIGQSIRDPRVHGLQPLDRREQPKRAALRDLN